ncbi:hypothetical protein QCO44_06865 [Selenomonas sputigena]|uniref:Uncharacterized protein n=1 Tax=Selenomonas sputigena TaxID=69823 RepID=A0ABV3X7A0_9FIRM
MITIMSSLAQEESRSILETPHGGRDGVLPTARQVSPTSDSSVMIEVSW